MGLWTFIRTGPVERPARGVSAAFSGRNFHGDRGPRGTVMYLYFVTYILGLNSAPAEIRNKAYTTSYG